MTDWREPALPLDEPPQGYREESHWLGCDWVHPDCHHPCAEAGDVLAAAGASGTKD